MSIKKYYAVADNTITNAYNSNLSTRGTGSNMGQSDILEVFSLYAQQSKTSAELSRAMIQFDIDSIQSDRAAGTIPASGSVSFYLKLYNAEHSRTLPRNYFLSVNAIEAQWEEGNGLDMDNYSDLTYDFTGSNWIRANKTSVSASAALTALSKTAGEANTRKLTVNDTSGNSVEFNIDNSTSTSTATTIGFSNANSNPNQFATNIAAAINAANAASALNVVASADSATVTLTQTAQGLKGNHAPDMTGTAISDSVVTVVNQFVGGNGKWATEGGDYHTDTSSSFTQYFNVGDEDMEINITELVEQWTTGGNLGNKSNYGVMVRLSASYEASSSVNVTGSTISYYTKKFFGRGTEFFFGRPSIEARWDSSRRDNRGNFYFKGPMATIGESLNTLYLYNYARGRLSDIQGNSGIVPTMKLYYSSGSVPEGGARQFENSSNSTVSSIAATRESKGVYYVQIATASSTYPNSPTKTTYPYLQDVWNYGGTEFFTGSAFRAKHFGIQNYDVSNTHVLTMPKLLKKYSNKKTERFRLFVRDKGWSPNIYTKATSAIKSKIIESASFQIMRTVDQKTVVPFGTGSDNYSMLSYDVSGNYFDFDMRLLEPGYTYAFKYSFYDDAVGNYREQPYLFKFKVENDEY